MKSGVPRRIGVIAFFMGLNVILGLYFLTLFQYPLPIFATNLLQKFNIIPTNYAAQNILQKVTREPDLSPTSVYEELNSYRADQGVEILQYSLSLSEIAVQMLQEYKKNNLDINKKPTKDLDTYLKEKKYSYEWVGNNVLVGPVFSDQTLSAIINDPDQKKTLVNPSFTEIGIATSIERLNGVDVGVVVQLFAQPRSKNSATSPVLRKPSKNISPREIPDEEVVTALNSYRGVHQIGALNIDQNLCTYAEKRANDLAAHGGLDNHEGFRKDFENPENPPDSIKAYSGGKIGENLAHQFCKNMTTGDSFVADSGTQLIEWCFDSSTKGHREAQLSRDFKNVCVRHAKNMYVVIFGD